MGTSLKNYSLKSIVIRLVSTLFFVKRQKLMKLIAKQKNYSERS
jgi:hypothetical protein